MLELFYLQSFLSHVQLENNIWSNQVQGHMMLAFPMSKIRPQLIIPFNSFHFLSCIPHSSHIGFHSVPQAHQAQNLSSECFLNMICSSPSFLLAALLQQLRSQLKYHFSEDNLQFTTSHNKTHEPQETWQVHYLILFFCTALFSGSLSYPCLLLCLILGHSQVRGLLQALQLGITPGGTQGTLWDAMKCPIQCSISPAPYRCPVGILSTQQQDSLLPNPWKSLKYLLQKMNPTPYRISFT